MIYWGDETGIDNCSNCERGFAPKGQPPVLPVETKRERLNMLSALSRQGNVRFMLYEDSMNQQRLIQFMDRLIRTSNQKVFLILDNLKVHHGKRPQPGWTGARIKSNCSFCRPMPRRAIRMNISTTRSSSRSILAACLRPNAISAIKQLLLCDPYNIALIRSPLSFNIARFPMF